MHDGKCYSSDHEFNHFSYKKTFLHSWMMPWDDNDFDEPTFQGSYCASEMIHAGVIAVSDMR